MRVANLSTRAFRVWQRNFDVFRSTWLSNFLPPLLEPVLYVFAFGFGIGSMVETVTYDGESVGYLRFVCPGVIAVAIMFWAYFETTFSTFVRMFYQKTFDALLATPLLVEDVIVGEMLWGATKAFIAGAIMLGMMTALGQAEWPSAAWVFPVTLVGGLFFSALGVLVTAIVPKIDWFNVPMFLVIFPMFLFSGTFFPVDVLPGWARAFAETLPLTHVSSLVRGACLGRSPPHLWVSVGYLALGTPLVAWFAARKMAGRLVK